MHNVCSLCSRSIHSDRWSRRGDYVSDTARESARAQERERERERESIRTDTPTDRTETEIETRAIETEAGKEMNELEESETPVSRFE